MILGLVASIAMMRALSWTAVDELSLIIFGTMTRWGTFTPCLPMSDAAMDVLAFRTKLTGWPIICT